MPYASALSAKRFYSQQNTGLLYCYLLCMAALIAPKGPPVLSFGPGLAHGLGPLLERGPGSSSLNKAQEDTEVSSTTAQIQWKQTLQIDIFTTSKTSS